MLPPRSEQVGLSTLLHPESGSTLKPSPPGDKLGDGVGSRLTQNHGYELLLLLSPKIPNGGIRLEATIPERKLHRTLDSRKAVGDRVHGPQMNRFHKAGEFMKTVRTRETGVQKAAALLGALGSPSSPPNQCVCGGANPCLLFVGEGCALWQQPAKGGRGEKLIAAN